MARQFMKGVEPDSQLDTHLSKRLIRSTCAAGLASSSGLDPWRCVG